MNIRPYVISFAALNAVTTFAAVPLRWTVETSRVQPAVFEAYQGETLTFEAALQSKGKPLEAPLNYSFFWQTNGMGSTYWEAPCPVPSSSLDGASTNVLFATFTPSMDVGARAYNCFIGSPSNIYHAAFQLRLRPSPGATPNALPLPTPVIDFARVRVLNPPWTLGGGGGCDTNTIDSLSNSAVVTNALTVATTNRVALLESSKADNSALAAHTANTDNPHAVTAAQVGAVGIGERIEFTQDMGEGLTAEAWFDPFLLALSNPNFGTAYHHGGYSEYYPAPGSEYDLGFIRIGTSKGHFGFDGFGVFISSGSIYTKYLHHTIEQWNQDGGLYTLLYFPEGQRGTIALQNWQSLSAMLDSTNATTLAENPTFSNAVMAVTQDFKTNTYTKTETDALIAANKPEYADVPSNVVWRIEAEGGRFFFKPVRPINMED